MLPPTKDALLHFLPKANMAKMAVVLRMPIRNPLNQHPLFSVVDDPSTHTHTRIRSLFPT